LKNRSSLAAKARAVLDELLAESARREAAVKAAEKAAEIAADAAETLRKNLEKESWWGQTFALRCLAPGSTSRSASDHRLFTRENAQRSRRPTEERRFDPYLTPL
jgi:hypothetical protein